VKQIKSTTIDNWGERTQRGRKVFFVKATSEVEVPGVSLVVTQLLDLHPTPGTVFAVTCTALAAGFAREEKDFETVMTSFEPLPDMTVAAFRAPGNLGAVRAVVAKASGDAAWAGVARVANRGRPMAQ